MSITPKNVILRAFKQKSMIEKLNSKDFLDSADSPIIDVRSPAEFEQGHIPGAFNIPLFTNEERAEVGILYKQSGRQGAIFKGLDLVGSKMSGFLREAIRLSPERKLRVHCWRGGMRSESMAWLFSMSGFQIQMLAGGYKAFRHYIREQLESNAKYVVLSGRTGSGKTEVLQELIKMDAQVIDLEGLAHHKGSSFGALGEEPQPSSEQFENDLYEVWKTMDLSRPIWLEDESRFIGKVSIPEPLFVKMRNCPVIRMEMPAELRVKRLVEDYANYPKEGLIAATERITRKLGGQHAVTAIEAIKNNDFKTAIEIVLFYYDKTYNYGVSKRDPDKVFPIDVNTANARMNAENILSFIKTHAII